MRGPQGERRGPGGDAAFNHRPAAGDHPFKLFIGGLPRHGCDEGTLREYFGQYGNVSRKVSCCFPQPKYNKFILENSM